MSYNPKKTPYEEAYEDGFFDAKAIMVRDLHKLLTRVQNTPDVSKNAVREIEYELRQIIKKHDKVPPT